MRSVGVIESTRGCEQGAHVCWVHGGDDDLSSPVATFLAEGLVRGERVALVTTDPLRRGRELLAGLGDIDRHLADGRLRIDDIAATYTDDPRQQVDAWADATLAAVADGFDGLRVAAEVTSLLGTHESIRAFGYYEHLVEKELPNLPFTAMCIYDGDVLGERAALLACLHPLTNLTTNTYRVLGYDGELVISGAIGDGARPPLAAVLDLVGAEGDVHIDATAITALDAPALLALERLPGIGRVIMRAPASARALADDLDLRQVEVVV